MSSQDFKNRRERGLKLNIFAEYKLHSYTKTCSKTEHATYTANTNIGGSGSGSLDKWLCHGDNVVQCGK